MRMPFLAFCVGVFIAFLGGSILQHQRVVFAQSTGEVQRLQSEISTRNERLKEIEAEIEQYKGELQKVGAEKSTLQKAIERLELERKKISADISYTQNRIGSTDLEISKLNLEISEAEGDITLNKGAISDLLRTLNETDQEPLLLAVLKTKNLSEIWNSVEEIESVQDAMRARVVELASLKRLLEEKLEEQQGKRDGLVKLKREYTDQQSVLSNTKQEKDQLLKQTRNKESNYQTLLKEKQAAREQIIKELRDFESKLQFILDPSTIPPPGTPVFNWPVQNIYITQYFGGTEFAKRNAGVYGGRAYHPGVDFGVPRGTKIYAPLSGVVRATGNTDAVSGCYSWGKWTLIDHANGLSTLYAHQDLISVSPGQKISTGDVIGYSGNTGYSTGPHLHFTVYATAGVSVRKFSEIKTVTACGAATTPVAATDAYIDPMLYLPKP